ncbi:hypothetical protein LTR53_010352 [Teratosphaeriaceae sp. CCFEE 6253]|nr:hypothetical protein LTR53_010352 [Teratosphaeriaceae sp. CCFEE 6253]
MSASKMTVQLSLLSGSNEMLLNTIEEQRIRAHSKTVRDALETISSDSTAKKVVLYGASPAALRFILQRIKGQAPLGQLHIKVHDMPLARAVAVYMAIEVLQVEPTQPHIEGHVLGYISHNNVTPDELMAVGIASYRRQSTSKMYRTLIQQVAWGLVHARYTEQEAGALQVKARQWVEFHDELHAKVMELQSRRRAFDTRRYAAAGEAED